MCFLQVFKRRPSMISTFRNLSLSNQLLKHTTRTGLKVIDSFTVHVHDVLMRKVMTFNVTDMKAMFYTDERIPLGLAIFYQKPT